MAAKPDPAPGMGAVIPTFLGIAALTTAATLVVWAITPPDPVTAADRAWINETLSTCMDTETQPGTSCYFALERIDACRFSPPCTALETLDILGEAGFERVARPYQKAIK
ncbi:MAG: hypothetical protein AAFQ51_05375 [Pseudomonadota bacterium]